HSDAEAVQRNLARAIDQFLERFSVERKINAVHVFAAQRRVHDDRRERMLDRIAGHSIDACSGVDLIDAVDIAQIARTDLTRCGFETGTGIDRAKSERTAGANAEHAADDPLLSHTEP